MSHCRKCGKEFFPTPEHVYRNGRDVYCSYTCFNHRCEPKKKRHTKQVEWRTMDGMLLNTYDSAKEATQLIIGEVINVKSIQKACRDKTSYKGYLWNYKNT